MVHHMARYTTDNIVHGRGVWMCGCGYLDALDGRAASCPARPWARYVDMFRECCGIEELDCDLPSLYISLSPLLALPAPMHACDCTVLSCVCLFCLKSDEICHTSHLMLPNVHTHHQRCHFDSMDSRHPAHHGEAASCPSDLNSSWHEAATF